MAEAPPSKTIDAGLKLGDIVLVRQDIHNLIPAIVTNDYAGQNTSGVVALVAFTAAPYDSNLTRAIANCQPETKDTSAEDLVSSFYGYWMLPSDTALRARNLQKEIDDHKAAATKDIEKPAETKVAP